MIADMNLSVPYCGVNVVLLLQLPLRLPLLGTEARACAMDGHREKSVDQPSPELLWLWLSVR